MPESRYWIWERSDGYIGASKGQKPPSGTPRGDTFEQLFDSEDWGPAHDFVEAARTASENHQRLVKSWD